MIHSAQNKMSCVFYVFLARFPVSLLQLLKKYEGLCCAFAQSINYSLGRASKMSWFLCDLSELMIRLLIM